jgi:hypothetical protein
VSRPIVLRVHHLCLLRAVTLLEKADSHALCFVVFIIAATAILPATGTIVQVLSEPMPATPTTSNSATPPAEIYGTITVPYSRDPPVVDGVCREDEYKGASVTRLLPSSLNNYDQDFVDTAEGYLVVEHDDKGLYGCIDFVSHRNVTNAFLNLIFDTNHDGMIAGKPVQDDYDVNGEMIIHTNAPFSIIKSSNTNNPYLRMIVIEACFSPSPNEPSSKRNLQWECFIPDEMIDSHPHEVDSDTIGFALNAAVPSRLQRSANYKNWLRYPPLIVLPDKHAVLADMTFLPESATTTSAVLSTSTATTSVSSSQTSIAPSGPSTAQGAGTITAEILTRPNHPFAVTIYLVAMVGVVTVVAISLVLVARKKRRAQQS